MDGFKSVLGLVAVWTTYAAAKMNVLATVLTAGITSMKDEFETISFMAAAGASLFVGVYHIVKTIRIIFPKKEKK